MDTDINKYYDWHNQTYTGQFYKYYEENGYYSDGIADELFDIDTNLIHFDHDFPFTI